MKVRRTIVTVLLLFLILGAGISPVQAVPPLPSSFYGLVKINGRNVQDGALVSATISGVQYALAAVQIYQGDTVYAVDVPGDDPATPGVIEGGNPGDTIVFLVNGMPAGETAPWQSGANIRHNLSLTLDRMIYLALISRSGP